MSVFFRELQIEPTNRCNLRCTICNHTFSADLVERDLSYPEFKSVIGKFTGVERVFLQGLGEPFMNPELLVMVSYATAKGIYTYTTSNMNLMTDDLIEEIFSSGLKEIRVSLDTPESELYMQIKSGGSLEKVIRSIKSINQAKERFKSSYPVIKINVVGMKDTVAGLPGLIEVAHGLGVSEVSLIPLVIHGSGKALEGESLASLPAGYVRPIIEKASALAASLNIDFVSGSSIEKHPGSVNIQRPTAPKCRYSLYIQSNGDISPCCNIAGGFGNIFKEDPAQLFNNERWKDLTGFIEKENPDCSVCTKYAQSGH